MSLSLSLLMLFFNSFRFNCLFIFCFNCLFNNGRLSSVVVVKLRLLLQRLRCTLLGDGLDLIDFGNGGGGGGGNSVFDVGEHDSFK